MFHSIRSSKRLFLSTIYHRVFTIALTTFTSIFSILVADYLFNKTGRAQTIESLIVVSSASYSRDSIAPGSLVTAFGEDLATVTAAADDADPNTPGVQLPTTLGGTVVRVKGVTASLLYVSPRQVNFIVPEGLTPSADYNDPIQIDVLSGSGVTSRGSAIVAAIAPAVFTMDGSGGGNPAAYLVRVKNDQVQDERLIGLDETGRLVFKPIDFGITGQADGERIFLVMFLSGIRRAPDPNQDGNLNEIVHVKFNGFELTPSYAGPQPNFRGLEQINVEIPRNFIGNPQIRIEITGGVSSNRTFVPLVVPPLTEARWRSSGLEDQDVHAFTTLGDILAVGAEKGLFRLSEEGTVWIESPYSNPTNQQRQRALALLKITDEQLVAGTDGSGLWYSDSLVRSWTVSELNGPLFNERILSLAQNQRMTFAGTAANGVFIQSRSIAPPWRSSGLSGQKILSLAAGVDRVFAGTELNGLMATSDDGASWARVEGGLPADLRVLSLSVRGRTIFAGTQSGLWRSNDDGVNWTKSVLPENLAINAVLADGSNIIAGSTGAGVHVSTDDGATWKQFNEGLTNQDVLSLINFDGRLFAGTKNGVFVADFVRSSSQPPTADPQMVTTQEDTRLAIKLTGSDPDRDPINFRIVTNPVRGRLIGDAPNLTYIPARNYNGEESFTFIATDFVTASAPATVSIRVNPVEDPLELRTVGDENAIVGGLVVFEITGFDPDGDKVKVTAPRLPPDAIFDQGAIQYQATVKWVPKSAGVYTLGFMASGENGETLTKDFKVTVTDPKPIDDWVEVPLFTDKRVTDILVKDSSIYLGLSGVGTDVSSALLRSNDNGRTWTKIGNGLPVNVNRYGVVDGAAALYLTCSEGLFRSIDGGANWTNISSGKGLPMNGRNMSIAAQGDKLLGMEFNQDFYLARRRRRMD